MSSRLTHPSLNEGWCLNRARSYEVTTPSVESVHTLGFPDFTWIDSKLMSSLFLQFLLDSVCGFQINGNIKRFLFCAISQQMVSVVVVQKYIDKDSMPCNI